MCFDYLNQKDDIFGTKGVAVFVFCGLTLIYITTILNYFGFI